MNTNGAILTEAAAKLTGISPRLAFYHMSQPQGDKGKSTKDFQRGRVPSHLNYREGGGLGEGEGEGAEGLNHVFQLNKRNQIKGFYL